MLNTMDADLFVPGHRTPVENIEKLVMINLKKIEEIINRIFEICEKPHNQEDLVKELCTFYGLNMDPNQHVLVSSSVRSYLSYMLEQDLLEYTFSNSQMLWKKKTINFPYKDHGHRGTDSITS